MDKQSFKHGVKQVSSKLPCTVRRKRREDGIMSGRDSLFNGQPSDQGKHRVPLNWFGRGERVVGESEAVVVAQVRRHRSDCIHEIVLPQQPRGVYVAGAEGLAQWPLFATEELCEFGLHTCIAGNCTARIHTAELARVY